MTPLCDGLSEKGLLQAVRDLAALLHLRTYHPHDSRRSEPGFPDLVIIGPGGILWRELKTATGRLSRSQIDWLTALRTAGADAGIWRPNDLANGTITKQLKTIHKAPQGDQP